LFGGAKMRIFTIFFHPSPKFTAVGGAEKRFLYILNEWLSRGVHVIVIDSQPGLLAKYGENCEVINLPNPLGVKAEKWLLIYLSWLLWIIKATFACIPLIKRKNCDIILSPNNTLPSLAIAVLLSFISRKPLCVVVHHFDFLHINAKASFWQVYLGYRKTGYDKLLALIKALSFFIMFGLLKCADICISVSESTAKFLLANGIPQSKIHVSGNAVDIEYISSIEYGEKIYDGIFVGRISRDKGIFDLVQSWKEITKIAQNPKLVIIGSGPDSDKLKSQIDNLGLKENIFFRGPCGDEELFRLMKSSKVFILPSMFEGWGMAIAEALACGLPVICYDVPAVREVFGACKSVFLVPVKDVTKLTLTILEVMNMNLKELAKFSKEYVKGFRWSTVALKDLEIIKQVLKTRSLEGSL
jgi:glycosyltransferase involved in cell wall biosynthesis